MSGFASAGVRAGEPAPPCAVQIFQDIVYHAVPADSDRYRHQLDVYRPEGKTGCPVLFFLHGGGWVIGKKDNYFGLYGYGTIARSLAERGLVVVLPNYRLSPGVRHPEHIKDAARAFAWTCRNAAAYGGDPRQIFVAGHSAGGHLAALLTTDERYLKEVGRCQDDIRGVVGISGVYRPDDLELALSVPGPGGAAVWRAALRPFAMVFGDDDEAIRAAAPVNHVHPGLPPFLLINAGLDYPRLRAMAEEFATTLRRNGCAVQTETLPWRTHETEVFDILHLEADRTMVDLIVHFIEQHLPTAAAIP
jgi:acetyl esterase/lipase